MTELQTTWGWVVAIYLFLGGLGAGVMFTASIISLLAGERLKATIRFGAWASAIAIACGTLFLLIDVGKPFRAIVLFRSFVQFSSWMTIGAWLLFGAILLNGLSALFWTDRVLAWMERRWKPLNTKRAIWRTILAIITIPVNLGVAIYTGVLLGVLPFRPLWNTWLLPALFTVSALDTGIALTTGYAFLREAAPAAARLRRVLEISAISLICIEAVVLGVYLHAGLNGTPDAARSAQALLSGVLGVVFWGLVVVVGLAVPLLACLGQVLGLGRRVPVLAPAIPLVGASACLIGGWTLRFVVLSAGLPIMLSSPAWQQILNGVRFLP
jgi:formate-dependent nitrite reductase membrane component NrfD